MGAYYLQGALLCRSETFDSIIMEAHYSDTTIQSVQSDICTLLRHPCVPYTMVIHILKDPTSL